MTTTIKEIARVAGVSRGTVDRVIHGRTGVAPEVREAVERILRELEYEPNTAAVALKGVSRNISIGVIVPDLRNEFFEDVYQGIEEASRRFKGYGITVQEYRMQDSTEAELLRGIDLLMEQGVGGIALQAIASDAVRGRLLELPPEFPVVTFNSDLAGSNRMCFVGQDAYAAGRVAGHLMSMQLQKQGKVAVIIGHAALAHQLERAHGFLSVLQESSPSAQVIGPFQAKEDETRAYQIVTELIRREEDLIGIYAAGGGQKSVASALSDSGKAMDIVMIGHDLLPKTVEYLNRGVVNCTIAQEPYYQGYVPVEILSEYLLFGQKPAEECLYTAIDIRIKDNISFSGFRAFKGVPRGTFSKRETKAKGPKKR